jgi:hypothetical protein
MDKELLFRPRLPEADVDVPGVGTVRVRALSRAEAMDVENAKGNAAIERRLLSLGLVDPVLSEMEVGLWQKAAPASELEDVSNKIAELSGLLPDSAKEAVKEFEANPDTEFRLLPGAEAGHDGGAAEGGNQ